MRTEETLADRLRRLRAEAGLSQRALAALAGLSQGAVDGVETGRRPDPGAGTVVKLAAALGVTTDELLGRR